jgi:hypothetical protein
MKAAAGLPAPRALRHVLARGLPRPGGRARAAPQSPAGPAVAPAAGPGAARGGSSRGESGGSEPAASKRVGAGPGWAAVSLHLQHLPTLPVSYLWTRPSPWAGRPCAPVVLQPDLARWGGPRGPPNLGPRSSRP